MKNKLFAAVLSVILFVSLPIYTCAEERACYLPEEYIDYCYEAQEQFGISAALIAAIIQVESSAKPEVKNGRCWGLMQVSTQHVAYEEDLLDPEQNIRFGVSVLDECREKAEGDLILTLLYYNGEPHAKQIYNDWLNNGNFGSYPTSYVCKVLETAEAIEREWYE